MRERSSVVESFEVAKRSTDKGASSGVIPVPLSETLKSDKPPSSKSIMMRVASRLRSFL